MAFFHEKPLKQQAIRISLGLYYIMFSLGLHEWLLPKSVRIGQRKNIFHTLFSFFLFDICCEFLAGYITVIGVEIIFL